MLTPEESKKLDQLERDAGDAKGLPRVNLALEEIGREAGTRPLATQLRRVAEGLRAQVAEEQASKDPNIRDGLASFEDQALASKTIELILYPNLDYKVGVYKLFKTEPKYKVLDLVLDPAGQWFRRLPGLMIQLVAAQLYGDDDDERN